MGKKVSPFDVSWVHMGPGVGFSPSQLREGKLVFDRGDGTYKTIEMPFKFGKDDDKDKDEDNVKGNGDVDFNMKGEMRPPPPKPPMRSRKKASLVDIYKPKVQKKTMKDGGIVRGAGCAQRGQGRGKIV